MPAFPLTKEQIERIIRENDKSEIILKIVQDMQTKIDKNNIMLTKLVVMISKMYQDGEINRETFNKLDDFLKPYHAHPYEDENY